MAEGKIIGWNKKVGDNVKPGDVLAEVETDKATMELESYNEGVLLYIGVNAGEAAEVDGILAVIGKEGEDYSVALSGAGDAENKTPEKKDTITETAAKPAADDKKPAESSAKVSLPEGAKEIRMPLLSDTMTEGKIVSWNKSVGDTVKSDDVLADVETDKATMEVVGYEEGTLLYIGVEAGNAAQINEIIAIVGKPGTDVSAYIAAEKSGANSAETPAETHAKTPASENIEQPAKDDKDAEALPASNDTPSTGRLIASPLAKKLAADKGIDITKISGTGDGGRVVKKDVDDYKEAPAQNAKKVTGAEKNTPASENTIPAVAAFAATTEEGHTDVPLTQMRKVIARRLGESMFTAPHFYLTMELTMDNAIAARTAINEISPAKVSFNDMIIKACAAALRLHPDVNSSWMGDFIRKNNHIHIGSALALPEGLIVPVIKFADQKSLSQIAAEAKELYAKAKDKKLQPTEFSGNTFTISNLGMMDIEEFTAIINPPDSCILAVGKIKETVVSRNGKFETANIMKVTLSCDHRSVDGAVGAAFLQTLKKFVENPVTMLV